MILIIEIRWQERLFEKKKKNQSSTGGESQ